MMQKEAHTVRDLAELAYLTFSHAQEQRVESQFQDILDFVGRIAREDVAPRPLSETISGVSNVLREDVAAASPGADALLSCAPDRRLRFVRVPSVL